MITIESTITAQLITSTSFEKINRSKFANLPQKQGPELGEKLGVNQQIFKGCLDVSQNQQAIELLIMFKNDRSLGLTPKN